VPLPEIGVPSDVLAALRQVADLLARGLITESEANSLTAVYDAMSRSFERQAVLGMEARIKALEAKDSEGVNRACAGRLADA
jgi:hypothetical protein